MIIGGVGTVCEELLYDEEEQDLIRYVDNIFGKPLNPKLVHAARMDEVKGIGEHRVWDSRPNVCKQL